MEYVVLLVYIAWLISSPRMVVRVPWLLTEVDLSMIWPLTSSELSDVCCYYVFISFM